jgi:hypothetical protein
MRKRLLVLALALVLGFATCELIGWARIHLPYSSTKVAITDALSLPGGIIAGIFYPEGVHTGHGAGVYWAILAVVSNNLVYALFWYGCLRVLRYLWVRWHRTEPSKPNA